MADPVSLMAVAGLVFAGRSLSKKPETYSVIESSPENPSPPQIIEFKENDFVSGVDYQQKREMESFAKSLASLRSSNFWILPVEVLGSS